MKRISRIFLLFFTLSLALTSCREQKDNSVEDAVEDVGDGIEDAADDVEDAVE